MPLHLHFSVSSSCRGLCPFIGWMIFVIGSNSIWVLTGVNLYKLSELVHELTNIYRSNSSSSNSRNFPLLYKIAAYSSSKMVAEIIWQNCKNVLRISVFLLLFLINVFGIFVIHMLVSVSLRCVNRRLFRRVQRFFEALFVRLLLSLVQLIAPNELVMSLPLEPENVALTEQKFAQLFSQGSDKFADSCAVSRDIIMANHQIYSDWIYLWALMDRIDRAGEVKIIMKRSLRQVPIFGWSMRFFDFVFLNRKWEKDQAHFRKKLDGFVESDSPFCLLIYPEGTTLNHRMLQKSESFASKLGVKPTSRVLLPRVLGMWEAVKALDKSLDGVYDLTVGYTGLTETDEPENIYTLGQLFYAGVTPAQVHYHLSYIPLKTIPCDNAEEFGEWLRSRFYEKDRLLDHFYQTGEFPNSRSVRRRLCPRFYLLQTLLQTILCLLSFFAWYLLTVKAVVPLITWSINRLIGT
jgi:lysocardiolipin and lysophospholipid acyltransferase